jgi:hypothetical protein
MSKGDRWAVQDGHELEGIDAQDVIERALFELNLAREAERAEQQEAARRAAETSGIPAEPPMDRLLTRADVAQVLRCSLRTVQRLEASGKLRRCAGLVRLVRFDRNEVSRFVSGSEGAVS